MSGACDGVTRLGDIGQIQSCGYLLAFEEDARCPSGMRVVCASYNIMEVPWIDASCRKKLLGRDLGEVLQKTFTDKVRSLVESQKQLRKPRVGYVAPKANRNSASIYVAAPLRAELETQDKKKIVTLSLVDGNPGVYILEQELKHGPHSTRVGQKPGIFQVADLISCIPIGSNPQLSTAALCDALADAMPAYDRAMVYRFAEDDGSGEVIHESIRPGSGVQSSYVGFHFPAADIPPTARELFKLVGARFIADTSAAGVPVSALQEGVAAVDLSRSALRAPADCHLRYLRNMGVIASLVVAIVVDDDLWGLFVFHGYSTPVHPSCEERVMVEMTATIAASLISRHQREEIATTAFALSRVLANLTNCRVQDFLSVEHVKLLRILEVDAIILCEQMRLVTVYGDRGLSLTLSECKELVALEKPSDRMILFGPLRGDGVAFFTVRSCLVAFVRGSVASHVKWAGKPDPPKVDGEPMGPRPSFDLFIEVGAAQYQSWSPATVDLLKMVRHALSSQLFAQFLPSDLQDTFAHVSHELRTPFHGVMGALKILEAETGTMDSGEQRDLLRSAVRCGDSMMGTLDSILDIAKDRNNTEVFQGRFTASSPVLLTMSAMGPFAATESVDLVADTEPADGVLEVIGDHRRIKGVLQNLVNNAIKFTPSGGKVRVSLVAFDSLQDVADWWAEEADRFDARRWMGSPAASNYEEGSPRTTKWHVYGVEDSGIGVLPSELPHLVAAYRQVSRGASKSHSGTGLGLHICKENVDIMRGALGISSTFAEGSKAGGTLFTVAVPLSLAEVSNAVEIDAEDSTKPDEKSLPRCRDTGPGKITILVVDDQTVNIKLLEHSIRRHFKGSGGEVQVLTASDGFKALEIHAALRNSDYDGPVLAGIFMDFHMPTFDGFECTKAIRLLEEEHHWPRLSVCGCTADTTDGSREKFKSVGGGDILGKPWHDGDVGRMCNVMVAKVSGA